MIRFQNPNPRHRAGYVSLVATLSITLLLFAFAVSAFRETRQAHAVQAVTQVRIDYAQKERAFLRALVDIVPNTAMQAMATNSSNRANQLNWSAIFSEALQRANVQQALDPSTISTLGISASAISANTGDTNLFNPVGLIRSPNGSSNFVLPSTQPNSFPSGLKLPPALRWNGSGSGNDLIYPIVSRNKTIPGASRQFAAIPYPNVNFGYTDQDSDFIAKRNWWAFTVNFGANTAAATGIRTTPKTYVLSIYEVPSQLAISSAGFTTSLGKFGDAGASDWDPAEISIQGSIYARKARIENLNRVGQVASRDGFELGTNAPQGQALADFSGRQEARARESITSFTAFSASSDAGLVSFTPINRGFDFFDFFADSDDSNRIAPTGWNDYSIGARSAKMTIDVCEWVRTTGAGNSNSQPRRLIVGPTFNTSSSNPNGSVFPWRASRGSAWNRPGEDAFDRRGATGTTLSPPGEFWPVQASDTEVHNLPDGRRYLTLDLEILPEFLRQAGADDVTINNSLWIGSRYDHPGENRRGDPNNSFDNRNIPPSNFPSDETDFALIITNSADLSAYRNGLTIITPFRVYFADDFNTVPTTPPAGSGITGEWFPPVSVFAPEKRFGILDTSGRIEIKGQIGFMPDSGTGEDIHPLDLRDGGTNLVDASSISADLEEISRIEDLPPISSISWLTTIEEVLPE